ncbi:MAG: hypothetical protein ACOVSW_12660 [Candidatus Kapaibacteriota bacterium]
MKTALSNIPLIVVVMLCFYSTRSMAQPSMAQQRLSTKDYLNDGDNYRFTNISFFEADTTATKRLLQEKHLQEHLQKHIQDGTIDKETLTKAYVVTERYQEGIKPQIFGAVIITLNKENAYYDSEIRKALRYPLQVFDLEDLKKIGTIAFQGVSHDSVKDKPGTMEEYLSDMIRTNPMDKVWVINRNSMGLPRVYHSPRTFGFSFGELSMLRDMASRAESPFGINPEDIKHYQSSYNDKRSTNPLTAFTVLHPHILSEATTIRICDSALIQELHATLGKAGIHNLSRNIEITLLDGECIRLQSENVELLGKTLVDVLPLSFRGGENNRLNVLKHIKISEYISDKHKLKELTMPVIAYCHQIVRCGIWEYADVFEPVYRTENDYNADFLYTVQDSTSALNWDALGSEYSDDANKTHKYVSLATIGRAREAVRYARAGIREYKNYEYSKAHPKEPPLSKKWTQPHDLTLEFDLNQYAPLAKGESWTGLGNYFLPEMTASLRYSGNTAVGIFLSNGSPDLSSTWSHNGFSSFRLGDIKLKGTSHIVTVTFTDLPLKPPDEERILQGSIEFTAAVKRIDSNGVIKREFRNVVVPVKQAYR